LGLCFREVRCQVGEHMSASFETEVGPWWVTSLLFVRISFLLSRFVYFPMKWTLLIQQSSSRI